MDPSNSVASSYLYEYMVQILTVPLSEGGYQTSILVQEEEVPGQTVLSNTLDEAEAEHQAALGRWKSATAAMCLHCRRDLSLIGSLAVIVDPGASEYVFCPQGRDHQHACISCEDLRHCEEHPRWCWECSSQTVCPTCLERQPEQ